MRFFFAGETNIDTVAMIRELKDADAVLLHERVSAQALAECCFAIARQRPVVLAFGRDRPPELLTLCVSVTLLDVRDRDQAVDLAGQCLAVTTADSYMYIEHADGLHQILMRVESPMEERLAIHMAATQMQPIPQHGVEVDGHAYRLDFAYPKKNIAIEVDGHDFHERTKEQAQRDKSRDRELQAAGWRVLRFTGSEIFHDAKACALEVRRIVEESFTETP